MFYALSKILAALLFKLLFRFEVHGRENIPKRGGCILASNHVSFLDPVALVVACFRTLHFMARDDLFTLPILGKFLLRVNVFPLKKERVDIEAIKKALGKLTEDKIVALFPEGGRIFNGRLGSGELGVGLLAYKAKVKIIPAFVKGSDLALPQHAKFIRLKKIKVYFGKPLVLDDIINNSAEKKQIYQQTTDAVMQSITQLKEKAL